MTNDIECEPPPEHKSPEPPESRRQSVILKVGEDALAAYDRKNLAHTKTASASIKALEPMSKPDAPTGDESLLKESSDFFGSELVLCEPSPSPSSQMQGDDLVQSHHAPPIVT